MSKLVLQIEAEIDQTHKVEGSTGTATMILFHGKANCDNFKGEILPGAADTQKETGGTRTLSARFCLEGTDSTGKFCHMFIENNGTMSGDEMKTTPIILTDSTALKFLENSKISGTVGATDKGFLMSFYQDD